MCVFVCVWLYVVCQYTQFMSSYLDARQFGGTAIVLFTTPMHTISVIYTKHVCTCTNRHTDNILSHV